MENEVTDVRMYFAACFKRITVKPANTELKNDGVNASFAESTKLVRCTFPTSSQRPSLEFFHSQLKTRRLRMNRFRQSMLPAPPL